MAMLGAKKDMSDSSSSSDVFERGNYQVETRTVKNSDPTKPPVELFIVFPNEKGTYPLLLFCHGFMLRNTGYTTLLKHIASHGYIAIAPQFYGFLPTPIPEEVKRAAEVTKWLPSGLPLVLPENVTGDVHNLALSGHSRGGKTAFALALGRIDDNTTPPPNPYKFKALIGIDPVAGAAPSNRPPPDILKYIPRCFDMSVPVAVIGTEYGNHKNGPVPPAAPDGVNHSEFFNECKPPACHFLAKEYGHMDMVDGDVDMVNWFVNMFKPFMCKKGKGSKDSMKRGVGGIVVAFLRCYLGKVEEDLNAIVAHPTMAPILLGPVTYVKD